MTVTTISSREFNRHISEAKRPQIKARCLSPTEARPAHVLLSIQEYQQLSGSKQKIADLLTMPGIEDLELEIPRMRELPRPVELA
jgi:hypothetical protein